MVDDTRPSEAHILTLSVVLQWQREGAGEKLLQHFIFFASIRRTICILINQIFEAAQRKRTQRHYQLSLSR
jgi:hypothetical protein